DMMALETVNNQYLGGDTSLLVAADTASRIDEVVLEIIKSAHRKAAEILDQNKSKLHELAQFLYEQETITGEQFMALLGE
ncbi:MAG: cell division protein FtsH, partial [Methylocystaceae bacterium]